MIFPTLDIKFPRKIYNMDSKIKPASVLIQVLSVVKFPEETLTSTEAISWTK
jgi:hypothetical protein